MRVLLASAAKSRTASKKKKAAAADYAKNMRAIVTAIRAEAKRCRALDGKIETSWQVADVAETRVSRLLGNITPGHIIPPTSAPTPGEEAADSLDGAADELLETMQSVLDDWHSETGWPR